MSFRHDIRTDLEEARAESRAAVVALAGGSGELLERAGLIPPETEIELGLLPVEAWASRADPRHVLTLPLPEPLHDIPGAKKLAFLPVRKRLFLIAVTTEETQEATLEESLQRETGRRGVEVVGPTRLARYLKREQP